MQRRELPRERSTCSAVWRSGRSCSDARNDFVSSSDALASAARIRSHCGAVVPPDRGPVMIWIILFNMLSITADLLNYDLAKQGAAVFPVVSNQDIAIVHSCVALVALAGGMRLALFAMKSKIWHSAHASGESIELRPQRIFAIYLLFLPFSYAIGLLGHTVSGLAQPAYAVGLARFAIIYLLSAAVFAANRQYV